MSAKRPDFVRRLAATRFWTGLFATVYLLARVPNLWSVAFLPAHRFDPVGPVAVLSMPLAPALYLPIVLLTLALAPLFAIGWRYRWVGPIFAVLLLGVLSYRNSWGMVFHTENLLVLHVLILSLSPAGAGVESDNKEHHAARWILRWMSFATVCTYFVAGWAKLERVGFHWFEGEMVQRQVAYDNARKLLLGDFYSPLGLWLAQWEWIWAPLAIAAFALELGAPLAMLHPRIAWIWAVGAWGFHVGVLLTMGILFPYPLFGIAYASFGAPERWFRFRGLRWLSRYAGIGRLPT